QRSLNPHALDLPRRRRRTDAGKRAESTAARGAVQGRRAQPGTGERSSIQKPGRSRILQRAVSVRWIGTGASGILHWTPPAESRAGSCSEGERDPEADGGGVSCGFRLEGRARSGSRWRQRPLRVSSRKASEIQKALPGPASTVYFVSPNRPAGRVNPV